MKDRDVKERNWFMLVAPAAAVAMLAALALVGPLAGGAGGQSCPTPPPTSTLPPDAPPGTDLSTDRIVLTKGPPGPVSEFDFTFTVEITAWINGYTLPNDVTVSLFISPASTATAGQDFERLTLPEITIKCGDKQATESFDLTVKDDDLIEPFYEEIVIDGTHDGGDHIDLEPVSILIQDGQDGMPESILDVAAKIGSKSNTVVLTWSVPDTPDPGDPPYGYEVLRYSDYDDAAGRRFDLSSDVCSNGACRWSNEGLAYNTEYTYTVRAINTSGFSISRIEAVATTGSAPGGL